MLSVPFTVLRWFRRHLFLLIAIGFSLGYPLFRLALTKYLTALSQSGDGEARAQAAQIQAQWVAMPGVASKLLVAVWFFVVANVLAWVSLRQSDVLPKWAKGRYAHEVNLLSVPGYKESFLKLTALERLTHYEKVMTRQLILFGLCILAAAVIQ